MVPLPLRLASALPLAVPARSEGSAPPLAKLLVSRGVLATGDLLHALEIAGSAPERLADILLAHRMVREDDLGETIALLAEAEFVDPLTEAPDARLIDRLGAAECLRGDVLPWRRAGSLTVILAARPERFAEARPRLEALFGEVRLAITTRTRLQDAVLRARRRALAARAEVLTPAHHSCRGSFARTLGLGLSAAGVATTATALAFPQATFAAFAAWAVFTMVAMSAFRLAAAFAARAARREPATTNVTSIEGLPTISILAPLYREREITEKLVQRLRRLDYPPDLLDICLVVEEDDTITQGAIARTNLPPCMRQIVVPRGQVQTKPRALNFALPFCRGSIIGVYDAEDAPDPAQLRVVAARFAAAAPDVACLQGVLDFYRPDENWLARCFTVEYAAWFRVVLPGLARLGFAVPLGGTTLFFRRAAIESLGGWDAHNVTEDADLGFRLARCGWRTELIATVTHEEPNCRPIRWVRQRSRWLKGFAMTWAVHMRNPRRLWRELGPQRFLGFQLTLLGTLSQYVLAPVIWSFWLLLAGLPHPLGGLGPDWAPTALTAVFLATEATTIGVGLYAVSIPSHRWLMPWVPSLHFYFPLGALAAYKGLWEMVTRPFYWDKTDHGYALTQARSPAVHTASD